MRAWLLIVLAGGGCAPSSVTVPSRAPEQPAAVSPVSPPPSSPFDVFNDPSAETVVLQRGERHNVRGIEIAYLGPDLDVVSPDDVEVWEYEVDDKPVHVPRNVTAELVVGGKLVILEYWLHGPQAAVYADAEPRLTDGDAVTRLREHLDAHGVILDGAEIESRTVTGRLFVEARRGDLVVATSSIGLYTRSLGSVSYPALEEAEPRPLRSKPGMTRALRPGEALVLPEGTVTIETLVDERETGRPRWRLSVAKGSKTAEVTIAGNESAYAELEAFDRVFTADTGRGIEFDIRVHPARATSSEQAAAEVARRYLAALGVRGHDTETTTESGVLIYRTQVGSYLPFELLVGLHTHTLSQIRFPSRPDECRWDPTRVGVGSHGPSRTRAATGLARGDVGPCPVPTGPGPSVPPQAAVARTRSSSTARTVRR